MQLFIVIGWGKEKWMEGYKYQVALLPKKKG